MVCWEEVDVFGLNELRACGCESGRSQLVGSAHREQQRTMREQQGQTAGGSPARCHSGDYP